MIRTILGLAAASFIAVSGAARADDAPGPKPPPVDKVSHTDLRVCADPANLPYSNDKQEGFENKIAQRVAKDLGETLSFTWYPDSQGFVRATLFKHRCDVIIGIASSGLHTNGYSLGRKIFFEQLGLNFKSRVPELKNTIGDELLKVHVSYGPLVQKLLKRFNSQLSTLNSQLPVRAFAHITGGGFVDNIPRVLPKTCDAVIRKGSWDMLPIFKMIAAKSGVPDDELYQVFNMGIGMVAIVAAEKAKDVLKFIRAQKHDAWLIGEIVKGKGETKVE